MGKKSRIIFSAPLVLASGSPRRRELLAQLGYDFKVLVADVSEKTPTHLTVAETTLLNARLKAVAVARLRRDAIVIGADTLVALDGEPLGKPRDLDDAFAMLSRLNGRTHEVFTGVWIECGARNFARGLVEVSRVHFRNLSAVEIRKYLTLVQPLDKAGAYAAQEDPIGLIAKIDGSRTNVIGLPMEALDAALTPLRA